MALGIQTTMTVLKRCRQMTASLKAASAEILPIEAAEEVQDLPVAGTVLVCCDGALVEIPHDQLADYRSGAMLIGSIFAAIFVTGAGLALLLRV